MMAFTITTKPIKGQAWTPEEDSVIRQFAREGRGWKECSLLLGRPYGSTKVRASQLKCDEDWGFVGPKKRYDALSTTDEQFIRDNASRMTVNAMAKSLGRSNSPVKNYCDRNDITPVVNHKLQVKHESLSAKEKAFIQSFHKQLTLSAMADKLNRSYSTIKRFCIKERLAPLRLRSLPARVDRITAEEEQFLAANYQTMRIGRLAKELNRTHSFVKRNLARLGLKAKQGRTVVDRGEPCKHCGCERAYLAGGHVSNRKYRCVECNRQSTNGSAMPSPLLTTIEQTFIRDNHTTMRVFEMADALDRPISTVHRFMFRHNLPSINPYHEWTEEEDRIIKEYASQGNGKWKRCIALLGVTRPVLKTRVQQLGLVVKYKKFSDKVICETHARGLSVCAAARELGTTWQTYAKYLQRLGLEHNPGEREYSVALGWPNVAYMYAVVLAAVEQIGKGTKEEVSAAAIQICDSRGWEQVAATPQSAKYSLYDLEQMAYLRRSKIKIGRQKHNVYRLRMGIKTMPEETRKAIAHIIQRERRTLRELSEQRHALVKEVNRAQVST